jgi:hypothetical protein
VLRRGKSGLTRQGLKVANIETEARPRMLVLLHTLGFARQTLESNSISSREDSVQEVVISSLKDVCKLNGRYVEDRLESLEEIQKVNDRGWPGESLLLSRSSVDAV